MNEGITLVTRRTIRATAARLFDAWTQPEQLRAWWGPRPVTCSGAEVDLRVGGRYRIANALPDGNTLVIEGEFQVVDAPHRLVYTWRAGDDQGSRVTVRFEPRGDATEVIVLHEQIPSERVRESHVGGWNGCLDGLEAFFDRSSASPSKQVPTLFDWLGGSEALERLFGEFYAKVSDDPVLAPIFAAMPPDHARAVAAFVGEVLGGPHGYSEKRGGHPEMIRHHLGRALTDAQRKRWIALLLECADTVGLPDDPEFRSAFVGYLEWGSRLAVMNSAPGATAVVDAPMPKWGWGEVKGPYSPPK